MMPHVSDRGLARLIIGRSLDALKPLISIVKRQQAAVWRARVARETAARYESIVRY
jgi:hypothetical protein